MKSFSLPMISAGLLLAASVTFTSCRRDLIGVDGSGATITETRNPGNFEGVELAIDAKVILHDSSACFVKISAQSNVLNVLTTDINGSKISIGFRRNVIRHSPITIHLYAPNYTLASLSGSGEIRNSDGLLNGNFNASISGSGKIDLTGLQASAVETKISGSGSIYLSGTGQSLQTKTSGSGDMHLFGLTVQTGDVTISGSGNVEINASQELDIKISGSGDVYYKNNPALDVQITGSGQVQHVN